MPALPLPAGLPGQTTLGAQHRHLRDRLPHSLLLPPLRPFAERLAKGLVISGRTRSRLILFTFDDGPDHRLTPRLLDALDRYRIKAVFFLTAARIAGLNERQRQQQAIARDIIRRGHIVANHTLDHIQLPLLNDAGVRAQVWGAERIFQNVLGERTWLIRPPGGARSPRVDRLVSSWGYTQMMWNLGSGDSQVRTAEDVFHTWKRVFERRERDEGDRGGIVLLHDIHPWSVDAFPLIMEYLLDRNCQLLERGDPLFDVISDPSVFFSPAAGPEQSSKSAPLARFDKDVDRMRQRRLRQETRRRCRSVALRPRQSRRARIR